MDLSKILAISGKNGLFRVVSQGKNTVIVESFADKRRFPAFGHEKMSSLEEISVFTTGEDKPLREVFKSFHEKLEGKPAIDPKSDSKDLKNFFLAMVPDFDPVRVYPSDMRKMIAWYNILVENDALDFSETKSETENEPGTGEEGSAPEAMSPTENA